MKTKDETIICCGTCQNHPQNPKRNEAFCDKCILNLVHGSEPYTYWVKAKGPTWRDAL